MPPESVADLERKQRFTQEARGASALNDPNIITIYDVSQAEGTDFIAMEYVQGKTLAELIGRNGLSLKDALNYSIRPPPLWLKHTPTASPSVGEDP